LDVLQHEHLMENALQVGNYLINEIQKFPRLKEVRGKGLMIGIEFEEPVKKLRERLLFEKKIFTGVSGSNIIRLLPPLCLTKQDADLFLDRFAEVLK